MIAQDYNQRQIDHQTLTIDHITGLVEFYQLFRNLEVDAKAGPETLGDLDSYFGFVHQDDSERAPTNLAQATLDHARSMLGEGEEGGNNSGPFVEMLHGKEYDGDSDDDGNWCAALLSECIDRACSDLGVEMESALFKRTGGAKALYKRTGRVGSFSSEPAAGDLVCWHRGKPGSWTGHIGLIIGITKGDGSRGDTLHTIEGNVGRYPSQVTKRTHRDFRRNPKLLGFAVLPAIG